MGMCQCGGSGPVFPTRARPESREKFYLASGEQGGAIAKHGALPHPERVKTATTNYTDSTDFIRVIGGISAAAGKRWFLPRYFRSRAAAKDGANAPGFSVCGDLPVHRFQAGRFLVWGGLAALLMAGTAPGAPASPRLAAEPGPGGWLASPAAPSRTDSAAKRAVPRRCYPRSAPRLLRRLNRESEAFYRRLRRRLVWVRLDPNPMHWLPANMQGGFRQWMQHWVIQHDFRARRHRPPGPAGHAAVITIIPRRRAATRPPSLTPYERQRLHWFLNNPHAETFLLQRYLWSEHPWQHPQLRPVLRLVRQRMDLLRMGVDRQVLGLVVHSGRRVFTPILLGLPGSPRAVTIITADGAKRRATVLGEDYSRGLTVLKLPVTADPASATLAVNLPRPAELLVALQVASPALQWTMPLGRAALRPGRGALPWFRLAGGQYVLFFNLRGQLAALANGPSAIGVCRRTEWLTAFIRSGQVPQWRLGLRYVMVPPDSPLRRQIPALGRRPAMLVQAVFNHSAAWAGGIKPGDLIVSIAGVPVGRWDSILHALRRGPRNIPVSLIRQKRPLLLQVRLHGWPVIKGKSKK